MRGVKLLTYLFLCFELKGQFVFHNTICFLVHIGSMSAVFYNFYCFFQSRLIFQADSRIYNVAGEPCSVVAYISHK